MKPKRNSLLSSSVFRNQLPCAAMLVISLCASHVSSAASTSWKAVASDGNWTTLGNWASGAVPGATRSGNSTNNDVVTFNAVSNFSTINIDVNRFVNSIIFDTGAGAYTFTGGLLYLSQSGSITMNAGVTNAQVFSNTWQAQAGSSTNGLYSFINNSTTSAATMTFNAATVALTNGNGRPTTLTLGGSNTGNNIISSNLTDASAGQNTNTIIKTGTGRWILSGNNSFTAALSSTVNQGIAINGGTLSAQNNNALGSASTATHDQVNINSTGTLELGNSITLAGGLILNLNSGGTYSSSGSNTSASTLKVSSAAAVTAALSTVGSSDVFTIGDGANDLTGGASDTVLSVSGPGTVLLSQASNYAGKWSLDAGTTKIGNATALGSAGVVAFGASSTGKLQLNGNSVTLTSLNTNATVGTPVIENNNSTAATLTVSNTSGTSTYGGVIQNGATGTLGLTKAGASTLTLSGANTYSGATTISGGVLNVTNTSGSATGTSAVSLGSATLTGAGIITGNLSTAAASIITPGTVTAGSAGAGVLTLGNVTLLGSTTINYGLVSGNATANYINAGVLTLPSSGTVLLNLYAPGTNTVFATAGTYDLFKYTSLAGGSLATAFSFGTSIAGYTPTFGTSGGYVQLTLTAAGVIGTWTGSASSNWGDSGNWSGGVPSGAGDSATFTSAPGTITLNANQTVGGITFNNASGYTVSGANTLTLDNNSAGATIATVAGAHDIQTSVALNDNVNVATDAGTQLTLSGTVSQATGTRSLTKTGTGTLVLSGSNSYSGGTFVNNGVLNFNGLSALGAGSTLDLGSVSTNGTLKYASGNTADISALTVNINAGGGTIDTNGNDVVFANAVGNSGTGGLTKTGLGKLSLAAGNTYSGANTISQGTLNIAADSSLGAVPGSVQTNLTFNPGAGNSATLQAGANITLSANRSLVFNNGTGVIDTQANTVTLTGASSGSGALSKTGSGNLTIASAQGYTGGTAVNNGTLQINFGGSLAGNIALANGTTFRLQSVGANSSFVGNAISVAAGATTTFVSSVTGNGYSGNLTSGDGSSVILVTGGAQGFNFSASNTKQFAGFTGTVNVVAGSNMDSRGTTNNNGGDNATFQIDGGVSSKNGGNWAFGALTGASTGNLAGNVTYTVGAKGIDSAYAGNITTTATTGLIKTGAGKLTLTGSANTYLGTTVSAGTLQIGDGGTTGSLGTTGVTNNGSLIFNRSDATSVGNAISGSGSLVQLGTGTLALTGASTYTGATTVSAGTLLLNGSLGNTAVSVGNSATLGGSGTIGTGTASLTVANGGTLAPGNSPGTVVVNGSTTLDSGSIYAYQYTGGGTAADLVDVNGALTITAGAILTLQDLGTYTVGDKFTLFAYDSLVGAGTFAGYADDQSYTVNGGEWFFNYNDDTAGLNGGSGAGYVTITAVPEPAAMLLGSLGILAILRRRRN